MLKALFKTAAAAAATVGVGYAIKSKRFTVSSAAARAKNAVTVSVKSSKDYDSGVAMTPPMGWSSWNLFRNKINEDLILQIGRAMVDSGLVAAGYNYLNLDDCWQSSARDEEGRFVADRTNFPRGIKPLVEDLNAMGIKVGIYSSNGTHTCEDLPASLGHEAVDAKTFAEWGIEYFKFDFCHSKPIPTYAPNIEKLSVGTPDGGDFLTINAEDAILEGHARLTTEPKRPGKFITGLSGNIGSATFENICVDEDGEYVITIGLRKFGSFYKFARLVVNGTDEYDFYVAPTMGFTPDGRQQITVHLNKGENTIKIFNPISSRMDGAALQYINMGKELRKATKEYAEKNGVAEKPICYSICEWGLNRPWIWGKEAGNLWRTTMDIKPFWASVVGIYEINVKLAKYAGPGGWNDPDMLEVGNGSLTDEENRSHFTLWCMMSAPLILGNDLRTYVGEDGKPNSDDKTLQTVTNKELIAIDQDPLGVQCRRYSTNVKVDVLVKPLENRELAVCFFNKFGEASTESVSIKDLLDKDYVGLPEADKYECKELWLDEKEYTSDALSVALPPHGVKVYRIKAI